MTGGGGGRKGQIERDIRENSYIVQLANSQPPVTQPKVTSVHMQVRLEREPQVEAARPFWIHGYCSRQIRHCQLLRVLMGELAQEGWKRGKEHTAQGGRLGVEVDVDIGAVPVPVGLQAVTMTAVVEVRRTRRKEVGERILVFVRRMICSRDGCAGVKGPTVDRYGGVEVYQREGRRGDSYTLPIRHCLLSCAYRAHPQKPLLFVVQ